MNIHTFLEGYNLREKQRYFLQYMYDNNENILDMCVNVGIHRRTFYDWLEGKTGFKEAYNKIKELKQEKEIYLAQEIMGVSYKKLMECIKNIKPKKSTKLDAMYLNIAFKFYNDVMNRNKPDNTEGNVEKEKDNLNKLADKFNPYGKE